MDILSRVKLILDPKKLGIDPNEPSGMVLVGNGKTGKALESRSMGGKPCPLMKLVDGHLTAPHCPSCYAVSVLNNYPQVRNSLVEENHSLVQIVAKAAHFDGNLTGKPVFPGERLRLYGLTDFRPDHVKTIKALSKVYKIDIISKTLWHFKPCREFLIELGKIKGICISLSFNKDEALAKLGGFGSMDESIQACRAFIHKHDLTKTISLNYTFTTSYRTTGRSEMEPYRRIPGVRVYHTVSKDKNKLAEVIGDAGVCGIFDEAGRRIKFFGIGLKGSCIGCDFCRKGEAA